MRFSAENQLREELCLREIDLTDEANCLKNNHSKEKCRPAFFIKNVMFKPF
jgi:hypothetical protein